MSNVIPMPELEVSATTITGSNDECQVHIDFSKIDDLNAVLGALNLMDDARRKRVTMPHGEHQLFYGASPETLLVYRPNEEGRYVAYLNVHWPLEWDTYHLRYAVQRMQTLRTEV